jgi:hypothetical protein
VRLAEAKTVLEARAKERLAAEQAEHEAKLEQRKQRERTTGHRPGGRPPTAPVPGARSGDQYNFTDPQSRIMKSSTHAGFEQDYNAQVAVDQASLLIVGCTLSNHPNDSQEAEPTLAAIPSEIGIPDAAALDAGYAGPCKANRLCQTRHRAVHRDRRMVSRLPGFQSQTLPYLILRIAQRHGILPARTAQHHRPCSACEKAPLSRFCPCHEGRVRSRSG